LELHRKPRRVPKSCHKKPIEGNATRAEMRRPTRSFRGPLPGGKSDGRRRLWRAIGEAGVAQLVAILKDSLFDPSSTKLRALRRTARGYCGQLNTRSRSNPDRAFHRFAIDLQAHEFFIPHFS
jgi:hypothetical protein